MGTRSARTVLALLAIALASQSAAAKIKLSVSTWIEYPETKAAIEAFEKKNPGVEVTFIAGHGGQYDQELLTWAAGGRTPDVMLMYDDGFASFAASNLLMEVGQLVSANELKQFYKPALETCRYKGKLFGLPHSWVVPMIYYNKQILAQAGIAPPADDWTWDDFLAIAKKTTLRGADGKTIQSGISQPWGNFNEHLEVSWVLANGGKFFTDDGSKCLMNSDEVVKAVTWCKDLYLTHKVVTLGTAFDEGKAALHLMMRWGLSWLNDPKSKMRNQFDLAPVPVPVKGFKDSKIKVATKFWTISRASKHKREALQLAKFLAGKEGQEIFSKSGPEGIPGVRGVKTKWPEQDQRFIEQEPRAAQFMAGVTQFRKVIDTFYSGMSPIWTGRDVRAALDDTTKRINNILQLRRR